MQDSCVRRIQRRIWTVPAHQAQVLHDSKNHLFQIVFLQNCTLVEDIFYYVQMHKNIGQNPIFIIVGFITDEMDNVKYTGCYILFCVPKALILSLHISEEEQ